MDLAAGRHFDCPVLGPVHGPRVLFRSPFACYRRGDSPAAGNIKKTIQDLREKCGLALNPLLMDADMLRRYEKFALPFDRAYGDRLSRLLDQEEYHVFYGVIRCMLEKKIRLEQECVEAEVD